MRRADKKIEKDVKSKKEYLKAYHPRIKAGDKSAPTYAQWVTASGTEKGLMTAGIGQKKLRRLKGK